MTPFVLTFSPIHLSIMGPILPPELVFEILHYMAHISHKDALTAIQICQDFRATAERVAFRSITCHPIRNMDSENSLETLPLLSNCESSSDSGSESESDTSSSVSSSAEIIVGADSHDVDGFLRFFNHADYSHLHVYVKELKFHGFDFVECHDYESESMCNLVELFPNLTTLHYISVSSIDHFHHLIPRLSKTIQSLHFKDCLIDTLFFMKPNSWFSIRELCFDGCILDDIPLYSRYGRQKISKSMHPQSLTCLSAFDDFLIRLQHPSLVLSLEKLTSLRISTFDMEEAIGAHHLNSLVNLRHLDFTFVPSERQSKSSSRLSFNWT